jgi:hypothetical protein
MNGGKNTSRVVEAFSARQVCGALDHKAAQTECPVINLSRSGGSVVKT